MAAKYKGFYSEYGDNSGLTTHSEYPCSQGYSLCLTADFIYFFILLQYCYLCRKMPASDYITAIDWSVDRWHNATFHCPGCCITRLAGQLPVIQETFVFTKALCAHIHVFYYNFKQCATGMSLCMKLFQSSKPSYWRKRPFWQR